MNLSLNNLLIHRFRGLREMNFRDLGTVNLLVGDNNAGKTSVLEALAIFCRPADLREWLAIVQRRESRPLSELVVDEFTWLFGRNGDQNDPAFPYSIHISGDGKTPIRDVKARCRVITGTLKAPVAIPGEAGEIEHWEEVESERHGVELRVRVDSPPPFVLVTGPPEDPSEVSFRIWADSPFEEGRNLGFSLPTRAVTPYSHRLERLQLSWLSDATEAGWKQQSVELLQKIDPNISDLEILAPRGTRALLAVRHAKLGVVPLSSLGEGIRRVITLALSVPSVRGGLLLIDEVETAIHVSMLSTVTSWLVSACQKFDVQVFATTHSLEAVDALLHAGSSGASEMVVYRLAEQTGVQRFSQDVMLRLRDERGLDVR